MYSFPYLEPVCCSMSSSNCCFLTCTQISQEVGQVVWYSHLFQNFPEFAVIHIVKGFSIVNKAKVDVFLQPSCFYGDPVDAEASCLLWALVLTSVCYLCLCCVCHCSGLFLLFLLSLFYPGGKSSCLCFQPLT